MPTARAVVEPVTVCDPAWVLAYGFVAFHGIDIDRTCVHMARVNLLRYGISPRFIRHGNALSMEFFDQPEPPPLPPAGTEPAPGDRLSTLAEPLPAAA